MKKSESSIVVIGTNTALAKRFYNSIKETIRSIPVKVIEGFDKNGNIDNYLEEIKVFHNVKSIIFFSDIFFYINNKKFEEWISSINSSIDIFFVKSNYFLIDHNNKIRFCKVNVFENISSFKSVKIIEFDCLLSNEIWNNELEILNKEIFKITRDRLLNIYDIDNQINYLLDIVNGLEYELNPSEKIKISVLEKEINLFPKYKSSYPIINNFNTKRGCSVNLLYRYSPFKMLNGKSVASFRIDLGAFVGKEFLKVKNLDSNKFDFVTPIPETGKFYAQGISKSLGIPYREVITKNPKITGRSFDIKKVNKRRKFIIDKLRVIEDLVFEKNIVVVDEAVFTGSTLRIAINLLKRAKVKSITVIIPSPYSKRNCDLNMMPNRTLLSMVVKENNLCEYFGISDIHFLKNSHYERKMLDSNKICTKCFNYEE